MKDMDFWVRNDSFRTPIATQTKTPLKEIKDVRYTRSYLLDRSPVTEKCRYIKYTGTYQAMSGDYVEFKFNDRNIMVHQPKQITFGNFFRSVRVNRDDFGKELSKHASLLLHSKFWNYIRGIKHLPSFLNQILQRFANNNYSLSDKNILYKSYNAHGKQILDSRERALMMKFFEVMWKGHSQMSIDHTTWKDLRKSARRDRAQNLLESEDRVAQNATDYSPPFRRKPIFTLREAFKASIKSKFCKAPPKKTVTYESEFPALPTLVKPAVVSSSPPKTEIARYAQMFTGMLPTFKMDVSHSHSIDLSKTQALGEILTQAVQNSAETLVSISKSVISQIIRFITTLYECLQSDVVPRTKLVLVMNYLLSFNWSMYEEKIVHFGEVLAQLLVTPPDRYAQSFTESMKACSAIESDETHDKDGGINFTLVKGLVMLFTQLMGLTFVPSIVANKSKLNKLDSYGKAIRSVDTIWRYLERLSSIALEYIQEYFQGDIYHENELIALEPDILSWMNEVRDYLNSSKLATFSISRDHASELIALKKKGDQFMITLTKVGFKSKSPKTMVYFQNFMNQLNKMVQSCASMYFNDQMREQPLLLYLLGRPGVGKSCLFPFLVKDLFAARGRTYDHNTDIYTRNTVQKHWDNYNQQKVVLFDDFLQIRDAEQNKLDIGEIINIKNNIPYNTNQAEVERKGNVRFLSELVVLTSNNDLRGAAETFCADKNALMRRLDFIVTVKLEDSMATDGGRLNQAKVLEVREATGSASFHPEWYLFKIEVNGKIKDNLSYAALITEITNYWKAMRNLDIEMLSSLNEWDYRERQQPVDDQVERLAQSGYFQNFTKSWTRSLVKEIEKPYVKDSTKTSPHAYLYDGPGVNSPGKMARFATSLGYSGFEIAQKSVERIQTEMNVNYEQAVDYYIHTLWYLDMPLKDFEDLCDEECISAVYKQPYNIIQEEMSIWRQHHVTFLEKCATGLKSGVQHISDWISKHPVTAAVTVGGLLISMMAIVRKCSMPSGQLEVQHGVSGDNKTTHYRRIPRKAPQRTAQGEIGGSLFVPTKLAALPISKKTSSYKDVKVDELISVLDKNLCFVYSSSNRCNGIFIKNRIIIVPYHMKYIFETTNTVSIVSFAFSQKYDYTKLAVWEDERNDVLALEIPDIPLRPDITGMFHSLNEHLELSDVEHIHMPVLRPRGEDIILTILSGSQFEVNDSVQKYKAVEPKAYNYPEFFKLTSSYSYCSNTLYGDCGAPVIMENTKYPRKILGFHVAGNPGSKLPTSLSNIITREYLLDLCSELDSSRVAMASPIVDFPLQGDGQLIKDECNLLLVGALEKSKAVFIPQNTDISKSKFHGVYTPTTAPAKINGANMTRVLKSQFMEAINIPGDLLQIAEDDIVQELKLISSRKYLAKKLTDKECLNGIPGDDYIQRLNLNTSPGYPYVLDKHPNGKMAYVTTDDDGTHSIGSRIKQDMDDWEASVKNGMLPLVYFVDVPKDERLPVQKVEQGKVRIFNTAPMHFSLLVRKYCLPFMAHVQQNHIKGECSVGLNVHSRDWDTFLRHFKTNRDLFFGGDYSKFDKRLPYPIMMSVMRICDRVMDDGNTVYRNALAETMYSAFHLYKDTVYRVYQGSPSGVPVTAVFNSIANSLIMRLAFLGVARSLDLPPSLALFNKSVSLRCYGDDNIVGVSDACKWFNMISVSEYLSSLGIVYTMPNKSSTLMAFTEFSKLTYLKRGFGQMEGFYEATLPLPIIQEIMQWKRRGNEQELSESAFMSTMLELAHYPEKIYDRVIDKIVDYSTKVKIPLKKILYPDVRKILHSTPDLASDLGMKFEDFLFMPCFAKLEAGSLA